LSLESVVFCQVEVSAMS